MWLWFLEHRSDQVQAESESKHTHLQCHVRFDSATRDAVAFHRFLWTLGSHY